MLCVRRLEQFANGTRLWYSLFTGLGKSALCPINSLPITNGTLLGKPKRASRG